MVDYLICFHHVDTSFIKDDEHTKKIGKLQEIICFIDEKNFSDSVDKIAGIGFTSDILASDLARNIIHLSCFNRSKIHLFVRLVSELSAISDIGSRLEQLIDYGIDIRANHFLLSLVDSGLISSSHRSRLIPKDEKNIYQRIIEEDNIDELKEAFVSPDFKINKIHKFAVLVLADLISVTEFSLIEFAALCGSIACFRFLYINNSKIDREIPVLRFEPVIVRIIHLAIVGGNLEIMTILEQANIHPDPSCIEYAIRSHRIEIFDWLIDQFPEPEFYSYYCLSNEFVHGINRIERINPINAFDESCSSGLISLVKLLLSNFSLRVGDGLSSACNSGNIEIVKLLLSLPSIDANTGFVS